MDALNSNILRSAALEEVIRAEIRSGGPMTFARFMDLALYHDDLGYYRAGRPMTRAGDFLTAPETHPVFGALLARFARAAVEALCSPQAHIVEQGAGTGVLARSITAYWRAAYPDTPLRYTIVEPHAPTRARLAEALPGVDCVSAIAEAAPLEGVFLSNELPDAFPVHRVRRRGGDLLEVFVAEAGGRLVEVEGPPSAPDLARAMAESGIALGENHEIEVCLELGPWIEGVASAVERGYVLTVDYGYEAEDAGRFPRGALLAHYRHTANEDYLERVGRQDLTAHVCWTALERLGDSAGLRTVERLGQREFLARWGWKDYGRWLLARPGATPRELDAVDRLGRPDDGLGRLGVLLQATGGVPVPRVEDAGEPAWEAVRSR